MKMRVSGSEIPAEKTVLRAAAVLVCAVSVQSAVITLQEGTAGYAGCTDTYIESANITDPSAYSGADANHGNDTILGVEADSYKNT